MYLFERLTGVYIYTLALFSVCLIISISKEDKLSKILFFYSIILSTMGLLFVPNPGSDLSRLIPMMNMYSKYSFKEILNISFKSVDPIFIIYVYAIGKLNIDGLLPAITAFIFFNNIFYIIKKTSYKYDVSSKNIIIILLYFMSTSIFMEVISGIRSMLSFSIISTCFYKEVEEEKSFIRNLPHYIISSLIHPVGIVLSIARVAFLLIQKEKYKKNRLLLILSFILSMFIISILGNDFLISTINKAENYIKFGEYSYFWEYLTGIIGLLITILVQIVTYKMVKKERQQIGIRNILRFSIIVTFITIFFSREYNIFHRFTLLNSIFNIPMISFIFNGKFDSTINLFYVKFIIILLSIFMLFISCFRGNLSSLKFFIL